jgi:uncharacterized membrane protein YciS (DUF1049 family)
VKYIIAFLFIFVISCDCGAYNDSQVNNYNVMSRYPVRIKEIVYMNHTYIIVVGSEGGGITHGAHCNCNRGVK